jgi:hypothetical protein
MRCRLPFVALFLVALTTAALAAGPDPVPVVTAHGKIDKVSKDTLVIQPRDESGKFGKAVTLHLTGTSKITTLSSRTMDKKLVMVQKDTDAKDLAAGQTIAVIYATPKGQEPVLLSAVVQPVEK